MLREMLLATALVTCSLNAAIVYDNTPLGPERASPSDPSNPRYIRQSEAQAANVFWDIGPGYSIRAVWELEEAVSLGGSGSSLLGFSAVVSGGTIDSSLTFLDFLWESLEVTPNGPFSLGTSIVAFTATPEVASPSLPSVFGWLEYTITDSGSPLMTLDRWAYEDTGGGIQAGAIPEPSVFGLISVASVMLLFGRRR